MEFILWILVVIFNVAAMMDAIRGPLSRVRKILWILLIFFLPLVGVILYFLLGRTGQNMA